MTLPDADRPTPPPPRLSQPPEPGRGWTPRARALVLGFATVMLAALVGHVTVTVQLTRTWPAVATVDLAAAVVSAAFLVWAARTPAVAAAPRGRRR